MNDRIHARYLIETPGDPRRAAEIMAGEQSSGTFIKLPGETPELLERAGARIEELTLLPGLNVPSLPGARPSPDGKVQRAEVVLSWPLANPGPSLPNLVATVAGNLFELQQFSGLRILDIELPAAFFERYPGPKFGVEGTRRLSGVASGPLVGTIVKPSIGFTPEQTADLVATLCAADIDFIKDDELQANGPSCPLAERVPAVMATIRKHAERTGKTVMFAFNITGDLDEMKRGHDLVLEAGGTCVMASLNSVGTVGMIELARHSALPIHAHRNGWGYLSRHPALGWSYVAWQKIWRLIGVDHMHVNGLDNKFCEENDSVIASARACLTPMSAEKPCIVMPVFSSGQTIRQPPETYRRLGSLDLIYAAGGGIMGHPDGPAAGVASLRQSWQATVVGTSLEDHAATHPELARALGAYAS
jgi:ribulose-bisphosphate carboxylase large chain